jgi:hypothetical protein
MGKWSSLEIEPLAEPRPATDVSVTQPEEDRGEQLAGGGDLRAAALTDPAVTTRRWNRRTWRSSWPAGSNTAPASSLLAMALSTASRRHS